MNFVDTFARSRELAKQAVFDVLDHRAIDLLSSLQEDVQIDEAGIDGQYHEDNPKIHLYHDGEYVASTNWSKTVKHAVATIKEKKPELTGKWSGAKATNESVDEEELYEYGVEDQLDELSRAMLGNYINKAGMDNVDKSIASSGENAKHASAAKVVNGSKILHHVIPYLLKTKQGKEFAHKRLQSYLSDNPSKSYKKIIKRTYGIEKAVAKLTKESAEDISEGVRKIGEYEQGRHKATIHKDSDWDEYRVKFYEDGIHRENADHHCPDKEDAVSTAKWQIDRSHAKDNE